MTTTASLRDRIIPWYFVLFFLVIALVNGIMIWLAVTTQPGLVTDHPYEKGLAYNQVIDAETTQEALGWKAKIEFTGTLLTVSLKDSAGQSIAVDAITAHFTRPTMQGLDFDAELRKIADNKWQAKVTLPRKGLWEIRINATQGSHTFQQARRIVAP